MRATDGVGTEVVDGGLVLCSACGNVRPDPLMLLVARQNRKLIEQQAAILERLDQLEGTRGESEENTVQGQELIGPAELARQLGKSSQWVRDHCEDLGGRRPGPGPRPRCWFDPVLARERFFASLATTNGSQPPKPERQPSRRRRQRTASTELLPVKGRAA